MFVYTSTAKQGGTNYLLISLLIFCFILLEFSNICAQNGWTKLEGIMQTSQSRAGSSACTVGDKIYIIGGYGWVNEGIVESFDPITFDFDTLASMITARGFIACDEVNGRIYTIGGGWPEMTKKNEAYDIASNTWSVKKELDSALSCSSGAAVDGIIYIIGGVSNFRICLAYDPVLDTFITKQPMPDGGGALCATVYNGLIYTFGGSTAAPNAPLDLVYAYNPATNEWTEKEPMPTARFALRSFLFNDKIYVVGGALRDSVSTGAVEIYDPVENTWQQLPDMPQPMAWFSGALANNKFYIFGGTADWTWPLFDVWVFDPTVVGVGEQETNIPEKFALQQNYPNPFNPETNIKYSIPTPSNVIIKIFDILGNEIITLVNEEKPAGSYSITWNAAGTPSGVYFYQLNAGNFIETKKMILVK